MPIEGFKELQRSLKKLGKATGGKALRSAAMSAMLPAFKDAQTAINVGSPPYGGYSTRGAGDFDPYPNITHKGRIRFPGYASRNVARRSFLSRDRRFARVSLGVKPEAFYAVSFSEFGDSKHSAKPWLVPSFRRSIPKVDARFRKMLRARMDKAVKGKAKKQ